MVDDNDRCLVTRILADGTRKRARLFSGFLSHYLIQDRYGRPGKGNDKVASRGWSAGPGATSWCRCRVLRWDDFNAWLEEQCRKRHADILWGCRGAGPCSVPCPIGGTGVDRSRTADDRAPDQGRQVPRGQKPGSFGFKAIPSLNKMQVLELARCEWIERRENVVALGPSGTGKTHVALGLGLAACQKGLAVGFITAAALVHELMEARDKRRLLRLQKQLVNPQAADHRRTGVRAPQQSAPIRLVQTPVALLSTAAENRATCRRQSGAVQRGIF